MEEFRGEGEGMGGGGGGKGREAGLGRSNQDIKKSNAIQIFL